MNILAPPSKHFTCEVCGQSAANPTIVGIESERDIMLQISLCHSCGPIDLELMQLCREVTLGCAAN
jgi:transcription elongation factor Elf1